MSFFQKGLFWRIRREGGKMEKSIEFGLEHYIHSIPGVQEIDPHMCSPLVLAYIGDCVFDPDHKDHGRRKRKQACTQTA